MPFRGSSHPKGPQLDFAIPPFPEPVGIFRFPQFAGPQRERVASSVFVSANSISIMTPDRDKS